MTEENYDAEMLDAVQQMLKDNKVCYSFDHMWANQHGGKSRVRGGPYKTNEEALHAKLSALKSAGWARPKWWQWWRWSEAKVQEV